MALDLASLPVEAGLALLALAALLAGIVNAMAGGGSLLILPLLVGLGLSPSVANGTMRVGVLVQGISATATFHARGVKQYALVRRLAIPMIVGAASGTMLATRISDEVLRPVFGAVLALWAVILVVRPGRFLTPPAEPREPGTVAFVAAAAVGVYGGFLQAGVGFPLLALLVLGLGHDPVRANAAKVTLVLAYTIVTLPMFALADQVAWREGLALATGALVGGWLGSRWQLARGAGVVRWFVVVMVALSGAAMIASAIG